MAEAHAQTPMIARTNRRHALPISFGFKVAGWIEELARAADRLATMERRVFRPALRWCGGRNACLRRSGARDQTGGWPSASVLVNCWSRVGAVNDIFADYVSAIGSMGNERSSASDESSNALMAEGIDEVSRPSTMGSSDPRRCPHKVNPKKVVQVIAMAAGSARGGGTRHGGSP